MVEPVMKTFDDLMNDNTYARMGKIVFCNESQKNEYLQKCNGQVHVNVSKLE